MSLTLTGKSLNQISDFKYKIGEVLPSSKEFSDVSQYYLSARQFTMSLQKSGLEHPQTREIVVKGISSTESFNIQEARKTTGRLVTLRLPPGEYELHSWSLRESGPNGDTKYTPPHSFSYRFNIRSGTATYIGRLNLNFGEHSAQRVAVEDRRSDDMIMLGRKRPALSRDQIVFEVGTLTGLLASNF